MSTGFGAFLVIYGSQLLVQMERITTSAPKTLEILIVSCRGFLILKKYQWCFYDSLNVQFLKTLTKHNQNGNGKYVRNDRH